MNYKDNIEWLKSLKQQIGKAQHYDLWHFEQVIDETIENLKPLAKPHGRLIDADVLLAIMRKRLYGNPEFDYIIGLFERQRTVIEAEQGDG